MTLDNRQAAAPIQPYALTARVLHWLIAVLVVTLIVVGLIIANTGDWPGKPVVYDLHKSTGILVLPLMVFRLLFRLTHPPPPLPSDIPAMQQFAAYANHWAFYALLIVQPILGWIATSAYRAPIPVYWLFELPPIWREDRAFSERMFTAHRAVGIVLAVLVTIHVLAALYHHFVRRDEVLLRMVRG